MIDTSKLVLNEIASMEASSLFLNSGIDYFIDESYVVMAKFIHPEQNKPMTYLNMGKDIEELVSRALHYKTHPEFSGAVYKLTGSVAIPVLYNDKEDIRHWA